MTRQEIEHKAKEIAMKNMVYYDEPQGNIDCSSFAECKKTALEMAEWLLFNQWVRVEDELPPQNERYSKYVIMRNRIGGHYIGCYDFEEKLWLDGNLEMIYMDITHWMPIPPLAEEGGEK